MDRYIRQTALNQVSEEDQETLRSKKVLIIGLGGLGGLTSSLLARAGVGHLTLIDTDKVELSNLHRLFELNEEDLGKSKAEATARKLRKINQETKIDVHNENFNVDNGERLVQEADVVIDGTDNLLTRFLINKVSVKRNTPWVYGACVGTVGTSFTFVPKKTPCLSCMIPKKPICTPECEEVGIMNTVPPVVSSHQVTQAIKLMMGKETLKKLFYFDLWKNKFQLVTVNKKEDCPICGNETED